MMATGTGTSLFWASGLIRDMTHQPFTCSTTDQTAKRVTAFTGKENPRVLPTCWGYRLISIKTRPEAVRKLYIYMKLK